MIMSKWEYIAEVFRYDLAIIVAIKESERRDVKNAVENSSRIG